jgi:hypothetical protein
MSRISQGRLTTNTTSNTCIFEIINSHATRAAFVKKITVTQNVAAVGVIEIGRPTAKGVTPTSPVAMETDEAGAASSVTSALAWGTAPTRPTTFLRRANMLATIGDKHDFDFGGRGVMLAPGETLSVHSFSGTSNTYNVSAEVEQDTITVSNP